MATTDSKMEHPVADPVEEVEKNSGASIGSSSARGELHEDDYAPTNEPSTTSDGGKIEKTKSEASVNDVSSIPNGGLRAWLQVLGAFALFFNTWCVRTVRQRRL